MAKSIKNTINELRVADEATKMKWLIGLSVVSIFFVVIMWVFYLDWSIVAISPVKEENNSPKISGIFRAGLNVLTGRVEGGLANSIIYFGNQLNSENRIFIDRSRQNFILDDLEALPKRNIE